MADVTYGPWLGARRIVLSGMDGRPRHVHLMRPEQDADAFDQALLRRAGDHGASHEAVPMSAVAPDASWTLSNASVAPGQGARSDLLSCLSHDLRTPMNAIIGFTYLLRQEESAPVPAGRLRIVADAADHLMTLLETLLTLAWMDSAAVQLSCQRFSLHAMLRDTCALVSSDAAKRQVHVDVVHTGVPEWVVGDSTRVMQALFNHASSAVRLHAPGRVCVRARLVGHCGEELKIRFEVHDTAAETAIPLVTEVLSLPDNVDRPGAAITTYLAALMGGEAGVQRSSVGGSIFWFTARFRLDASALE